MQADQITRFWDKYIRKLIHYNVPEKARRWHVKRAEECIQARPGMPLKKCQEENLTKWLNDLGRNARFRC